MTVLFAGVTAARGNLYEALVIFVDLQEKCLEFSLNASLVNAVKNRTEKFGKVSYISLAYWSQSPTGELSQCHFIRHLSVLT